MQTANGKIKISLTLDEYESELLRAAAKIALPPAYDEICSRSDNRRLLRLALLAFLRGAITDGRRINCPMVAELRPETADEVFERTGIRDAHNLSPAELRYCEAEGIKPMDFLKTKLSQ